MSFNSLHFLLFLPMVVITYWFLPQRFRTLLLFFSSYYFYMSWNAKLLWLIVGISLLTYTSSRMIARENNKSKRKILLVVTLFVCFGFLFYFKYFNFVAMSFFHHPLHIVLPVGISFYTFQALSYVIDVYKGRIQAEKNVIEYALYISFFPQLVAGPIERSDHLLPQLKQKQEFCAEYLREGVLLLLSGFFRKVVVADQVGRIVDLIFALGVKADGSLVVLGLCLFSVQIYCDFSGYSEIASGSARLMGISLMRNFNRPYKAKGIREFWRRWHISLGRWFSDYVYIPLGGNRKGKTRKYLAIVVVFLLSGMWHGASWTFFIWGAIHALYYCIESISGRNVGKIGTFLLVSLSWVFFRSTNVAEAFSRFQRIFEPWKISKWIEFIEPNEQYILQIVLAILLLPILNRFVDQVYQKETKWTLSQVYLLTIIGLTWIGNLVHQGNNVFIYFQF